MPNYFFSFRTVDPALWAAAAKLQATATAAFPGMAHALTPVPEMHVTLGVVALPTPDAVARAGAVLAALAPAVDAWYKEAAVGGRPPQVRYNNTATFGRRVWYAEPEKEGSTAVFMRRVAAALAAGCRAAGLSESDAPTDGAAVLTPAVIAAVEAAAAAVPADGSSGGGGGRPWVAHSTLAKFGGGGGGGRGGRGGGGRGGGRGGSAAAGGSGSGGGGGGESDEGEGGGGSIRMTELPYAILEDATYSGVALGSAPLLSVQLNAMGGPRNPATLYYRTAAALILSPAAPYAMRHGEAECSAIDFDAATVDPRAYAAWLPAPGGKK